MLNRFFASHSTFFITPDIFWQGLVYKIYAIPQVFQHAQGMDLMKLIITCWIWFSYTLFKVVAHFKNIIPRMAMGGHCRDFQTPLTGTNSCTKSEGQEMWNDTEENLTGLLERGMRPWIEDDK